MPPSFVAEMTERSSTPTDPGTAPRQLEKHRARRRKVGFDHAAVIAYDGRFFAGYARQPNRRTVEGGIRTALEPVIPGLRRLAVAGRTDRGVSATYQVISFRGDASIAADELRRALGQIAPEHLQCRFAGPAPRGFHAQFWALERRYAYLYPARAEDLALQPRIEALLLELEGRRCLRAFSRETPEGRSTVRHLLRARCQLRHLDEQPVLCFELVANGFLRRMVRVLVATALEAARSKAPSSTLVRIAQTQDRSLTARAAPPEHLRLVGVGYARWSPPLGP